MQLAHHFYENLESGWFVSVIAYSRDAQPTVGEPEALTWARTTWGEPYTHFPTQAKAVAGPAFMILIMIARLLSGATIREL